MTSTMSNEKINLKIAQHNVRSLHSSKHQLINYLERNGTYLYMVSETWLKNGADFIVRNYTSLLKNRDDGYGGVGIIYKNSILTEQFLEGRHCMRFSAGMLI